MPRFTLFLIIFWTQAAFSFGQSVYVPLNPDYYHLVDRYEIKSGKNAIGFQSTVKPYLRKSVYQLVDSLNCDQCADLSPVDKFNIQYLKDDSWEWSQDPKTADSEKPFWKYFYGKKNDLYSLRNDDVELHVNPVLYGMLGGGKDASTYSYINTRGVEIRGSIGKKIGFYTYFTDTQLRMPGYFTERMEKFQAVPGEAAWKVFKGTPDGKFTDKSGADFYTARGYLTFDPIKQINVQFGHDKVFIGNGFRSVILSDNSGPFLFLKLTTRIGRVQYMNLFAEINNAQNNLAYGDLPPKKFLALHHLGVNIGKNLNVGVFEAIVHSRDKSQGYFDLGYMNPVIFYRAIEAQKYSADNSMLGIDFRWNFLRRFQAYGQLNLDEFNLNKLRAGTGWWGNKIAAQIGAKYVDVLGVENLDIQAEFNLARPYTFQHVSDKTNYVNFNQAMAHPFGGNFKEFVGIVRYQPLPRLTLTGTFVGANYGLDFAGRNFGGNPLLSYNTRPQDREYGNYIGQGVGTSLLYGEFAATYQIRHNIFLDFRQVVRNQNSVLDQFDRQTVFSSFSVRINSAQRLLAF